MPELRKLSNDVDCDWLSIWSNQMEDIDVQHLVSSYENRFRNLEDQFVPQDLFKPNKKVETEANENAKQFFDSHYPINTEGRENEP